VAEDGRRDVVREVGDDGVGAAAPRLPQELFGAQGKDVGADDGDVSEGLELLAKVEAELLVHLHGHHGAGPGRQLDGEDAEAGADFDGGLVRGDLSGSDDARQDLAVDQEVLGEAFARPQASGA
jgi:hypothetical protein